MALRVISAETTARDGVIVIEGDSQEEVCSPAARVLAINEASKNGMSKAGTSGTSSPYPIDAQGQMSEGVILGRVPVAAYRCDYNVTAGL